LIVYDQTERWIAAVTSQKPEEFARTVRQELLQSLPLFNRFLMQHLFKFLNLVVQHKLNNKMEPSNLAIVFGLSLIRRKDVREEKGGKEGKLIISSSSSLLPSLFILAGRSF
jgi:hypothetical protein